jgi:hypothetical protein
VRLVHSGVNRAAETAGIIAQALPPHVAVEEDALLAEGYPCIPEPSLNLKVRVSCCDCARSSCSAAVHFVRVRGLGPH